MFAQASSGLSHLERASPFLIALVALAAAVPLGSKLMSKVTDDVSRFLSDVSPVAGTNQRGVDQTRRRLERAIAYYADSSTLVAACSPAAIALAIGAAGDVEALQVVYTVILLIGLSGFGYVFLATPSNYGSRWSGRLNLTPVALVAVVLNLIAALATLFVG